MTPPPPLIPPVGTARTPHMSLAATVAMPQPDQQQRHKTPIVKAPWLVALLPPVSLHWPLPPPTSTALEAVPEAWQTAPPCARLPSAANSLRLRPASTPPSISPVGATTQSGLNFSRWGTAGSSVGTIITCVAPIMSGLPVMAVQPQRNAATSICFAISTCDPAHRDPG